MTYKTTTLDTFVTLQRGFDLPAQDRIPGDIPIIAANGPVGFHNIAKVNTQCVVLGRSGSVGNPQLITGAFWPLNTTLFVKDFHGNSPTFVYYVLKTIDFKSFDAGGTVPTLNRNHLTQIEVPLLDLAHQESIGGVLRNLDLKIAANNALSRTLEEIAQRIFKSWFIDFDPVKAKMAGDKPDGMDAATADLFPDAMEESGFGLIPTGWEVKTLGDVITVLESGKRARGGAQDSGVPSIGAESIRGLGKFDYSSKKFVSEEFYNDLPTGKVRPYDVLVYKDGAGAGSYVSMFGEGFPFEKFAINEHVFLLRSDSLPQSFLYFWLSEKKQKRLMIELAQKSAQPGLNQQDTKSIPILVPSNKVCEAFEKITRPMISYILKNSRQDKELETLRDTLLPRLISGELQIPEEMLDS